MKIARIIILVAIVATAIIYMFLYQTTPVTLALMPSVLLSVAICLHQCKKVNDVVPFILEVLTLLSLLYIYFIWGKEPL
jgi:uncharacterized membrane protein (UPF0136 family)